MSKISDMKTKRKILIVVILFLGIIIYLLTRWNNVQEDGLSYFFLHNTSRGIRLENPLIYDDFSDRYVFSSVLFDSSVIGKPDFTAREDVYVLSRSVSLGPLDTVFCCDSYNLYKYDDDYYGDVFDTNMFPRITYTVGDADEIDYILYRYCSGYYDFSLTPKVLVSRYLKKNIKSHIPPGILLREGFAIAKSNMKNPRKPTAYMEDTINTYENIIYEHPLIYIPYPLDGTPYIFSDRVLSTFEFDSRFCGKRNFYAVQYKTELPLNMICNIICFDSNGVLAELKPEYNETRYPLYLRKNILPTGHWDKTYISYVKNTDVFKFKTKFIKDTDADCRWDEIKMLSDKVDTFPSDYDPSIFINAYSLINNKIKQ